MRIKLTKVVSAILVIVVAIAPIASNACTSFILHNKDGSYVYARTSEFGATLPLKVAVYPRNYQWLGTGPDGKAGSGIHWTGKYAVTGLNAFDQQILADGMNEKGLAGGMLYLPVSSKYQNPIGDDAKKSLASTQVVNYVLSNFATVSEVKAGLEKIFVNQSIFAPWKAIGTFHYTFHDMTGKSIVIEYVGGKMNAYDNPVGTMTNEPPFDWHMMNIENYLNLTPIDVGSKVIDGVTFAPRGAGSGMHGLPGDFGPASRFIRAAFYSAAADKYAAGLPRVQTAWHLLNMFDIPPGASVGNDGKVDAAGKYLYDYTQQSVVADPKNLTYYARFYGGSDIFQINMKDHDWNAKDVKLFPIPSTSTYKTVQ